MPIQVERFAKALVTLIVGIATRRFYVSKWVFLSEGHCVRIKAQNCKFMLYDNVSCVALSKMWKVSSRGRLYRSGKPLSSDLRSSIIDKIIERGGNTTNGYFPAGYVDITNELNLSPQVVSKIWKQFAQMKSLSPLKHGGGNKSGLSDGDLQLIEVLKRNKPSISYSEIENILIEVGDLPLGSTSTTALSNAVRKRMRSGEAFTYKK